MANKFFNTITREHSIGNIFRNYRQTQCRNIILVLAMRPIMTINQRIDIGQGTLDILKMTPGGTCSKIPLNHSFPWMVKIENFNDISKHMREHGGKRY